LQGKDKRITDLIQDVFKKINIKNLINDILNAPLYGYQVLEIIWWIENINGNEYCFPTAIIAKPFDWFIFNKFNQLLLVTKDKPEGQLLPELKFLVVQSNPSYLNPYGDPVLSKCLWPIVFKKGGLTFWMKFMEKHGIPKFIGKTDLIDENDLALFQAQIDGLLQDASAVIGKEEEINMLTATGSVGVNLYKELIEFCNTEISKAILSTTLTTEIQGGGSYAAGKVHAEVREDIVDADKLLVEQTINKLIQWITELNFGQETEPPTFVIFPKEDVDRPLAEVVDLITKNNQILF
jgi:phage gp29-like protein